MSGCYPKPSWCGALNGDLTLSRHQRRKLDHVAMRLGDDQQGPTSYPGRPRCLSHSIRPWSSSSWPAEHPQPDVDATMSMPAWINEGGHDFSLPRVLLLLSWCPACDGYGSGARALEFYRLDGESARTEAARFPARTPEFCWKRCARGHRRSLLGRSRCIRHAGPSHQWPHQSATLRFPPGPRAMRRFGPRRWLVKWAGRLGFGPRGWIWLSLFFSFLVFFSNLFSISLILDLNPNLVLDLNTQIWILLWMKYYL